MAAPGLWDTVGIFHTEQGSRAPVVTLQPAPSGRSPCRAGLTSPQSSPVMPRRCRAKPVGRQGCYITMLLTHLLLKAGLRLRLTAEAKEPLPETL